MIPFLVHILIVLVIVALLLWIVQQIPGLDPTIANIIRVVAIVIVCLWLIYLLAGYVGPGLWPSRR